MKYSRLVQAIDDETLYNPALIARFAEEKGFLKSCQTDLTARRLEKRRIRIILARFSTNHGFPRPGDGLIQLYGRRVFIGWFGWRWKAALKERSLIPPKEPLPLSATPKEEIKATPE